MDSIIETNLSGDLLFNNAGPCRHRDFIKRKRFVIGLFFASSFKRLLFKMAADSLSRRFCFIKSNFIKISSGGVVKKSGIPGSPDSRLCNLPIGRKCVRFALLVKLFDILLIKEYDKSNLKLDFNKEV